MTIRTVAATLGLAALAGVAFAGPGKQPLQITRSGSRLAVAAPAEHFTGVVRIQPLFDAIAPARTSGASVTFEAGARTAWHMHPLGQRLIVTSGVGRIQRSGDPIEEIRPGDVVWIPPGQKHWHGATPTSPMTHIAIHEALGGKVVDWLEQVSDEQYRGETSMKIGITVQGRVIEATLIDSETTRDFVSLLPLTLSMGDLYQREKFGHLPRAISEGGTRRKTYEVGDLVYWSPGPDVAIYYRHAGQSIPDPGIIVIGKVGPGGGWMTARRDVSCRPQRRRRLERSAPGTTRSSARSTPARMKSPRRSAQSGTGSWPAYSTSSGAIPTAACCSSAPPPMRS